MPQTRHIVVLGSLNTDLVTVTTRIPVGGETLTATSFSTGPGGKGLNQAVACARAAITSGGYKTINVVMLGATGTSNEDLLSDALHNTLKMEEIDGSGIVRIPGISSGTATILVEGKTGENRILVVPGANGQIDPSFLERPDFTSKLWGYANISEAALLILQLEIPLETVIEVIAQANTHGVPVLLNPAPAVKTLPKETLAQVDYLIVNETEAEIILSDHENLSGLKSGDDEWLQRVFKAFAKIGVKQLIVTLGARGACYSIPTPDDYEFVPAVKVPAECVIDTTAAGDTFVGTYAIELVKFKGQEINTKRAVERACKASALTVQRSGAVSSIPFGNEY